MQRWNFAGRRGWWLRIVLAAFVAANGLSLARRVRGYLHARHVVDSVTSTDTAFARMLAHLPARGRIGYLKPDYERSNAADLGEFFRTQYALAPRILITGTEPDFVVAVARADMPPVPDGFVVETAFSGRVALYRRVR